MAISTFAEPGPPGEIYKMVKRHKRLWIVRGDELIYTPPNFLRPPNRLGLLALADMLNEGMSYIKAIIEFESNCPRA